jgi:hypothetical protein
MRPLILLAAVGLASSGCSGPAPGPWQKPGADAETVKRDTFACRSAARDEAIRHYPYGINISGAGAAGAVASYQQDDTNRTIVEVAQFNDCMRERGYKRG